MTEESLEEFIRCPEGPVTIFYWPFISIAIISMIWGILTSHAPLTIFSGIFLMTILIGLLWSGFSLDHIRYKGTLNEYRAFPGETIQLEMQVSNEKPLPLGWLEIDVDAPSRLLTKNTSLQVLTSMLWFRKARWRFPLYCASRGYYPIGPVAIRSGDIFGFFTRSTVIHDIQHLIVYPKIAPLPDLDLPLKYPFGEVGSPYKLFEDLSRFIGVREYSPEDTFKRIHWKASARLRRLQVKTYEATMELSLILLLDVESFKDGEGNFGVERFEWGISLIASLAYYALRRRVPVGLLINGNTPEGGEYVKVAASRSPSQLTQILECLAKLQPRPSLSFEAMMMAERDGIPSGATLTFVTNTLDESLPSLLSILKKAGHRVAVLHVGERDHGWLPEKTVISVRPQGGV